MKAISIVTPPLGQIYSQKFQYEQHKRKLMSIYEERKSHLNIDPTRNNQFENFKENKTKSFIHKFNQNNQNISKQNLKILGKIQKVKPSLSHSASEQKRRNSFSCKIPFNKQKMIQTQKENIRISNRMRNMSSPLNPKNFERDYCKSQQIKNRLMKYTSEQNKVFLKSERYFGDDGTQSVTSNKSRSKSIKAKQLTGLNGIPENRRQMAKTMYKVSYYKKQDILKNKVDVTTSSLAAIKNKKRHDFSLQQQSILNAEVEDQKTFFSTQPNRRRMNRKTYLQ